MIEMFLSHALRVLQDLLAEALTEREKGSTVTVPHAIEATVRTALFFLRRASAGRGAGRREGRILHAVSSELHREAGSRRDRLARGK